MPTPLTDDELDAALARSSARLAVRTGGLSVGAAPRPSFPTTAMVRATAASLLVTGTVIGLLAVTRDGADPLPPGFAEGRFGPEVVLHEVDDGDGDGDTRLLRTEPGGRELRVFWGEAAAKRTVVTTPTGAQSAGSATRCVDLADGTGFCGSAFPPPGEMMLSDRRGAKGAAVLVDLPGDVVAVRFDAGPEERWWGRPVDGLLVFPYGETATPGAMATLVRADGSIVTRFSATNENPTDTEIATGQVTQSTEETLPTMWTFGERPSDESRGGTYLRRSGRSVLTGYDGPFSIQTIFPGPTQADIRTQALGVISVPTDRADEVRTRLALPTGNVDLVRDAGDGTTVLVWVGSAVDPAVVDAAVAGLRAGVPADVADLDRARAFGGGPDNGRIGGYGGGLPLEALLNDSVTTISVDGSERQLWAAADDLGEVWFSLTTDGLDSPYGIAPVRRGVALPPLAPGTQLGPGLWAVPASTVSLTMILDDGSSISPVLVDVRPLSDAMLAILPTAVAGRTVRSVDLGQN